MKNFPWKVETRSHFENKLGASGNFMEAAIFLLFFMHFTVLKWTVSLSSVA